MFSSLKAAANSAKDSMLSMSIQKLINHKAKKLCVTLSDFSIDTAQKCIQATLIFDDEPEPLTLTGKDYQITSKNGKYFLEIGEIEKSRVWTNSYIDGKRYKIPPDIVKIAEILL